MASIIIKSTDPALTLDQNRRKGMVDAGAKIAFKIDAVSAVSGPFDAAFAKAVVLDTLAAFITDKTHYVVEYMDRPLSVTSAPHIFEYTDATGTQKLEIKPVADERVKKMNITVPVPVTPINSVLQGYGTEVIADVVALNSSSSSSALADTQRYLLATAMFRRCR